MLNTTNITCFCGVSMYFFATHLIMISIDVLALNNPFWKIIDFIENLEMMQLHTKIDMCDSLLNGRRSSKYPNIDACFPASLLTFSGICFWYCFSRLCIFILSIIWYSFYLVYYLLFKLFYIFSSLAIWLSSKNDKW